MIIDNSDNSDKKDDIILISLPKYGLTNSYEDIEYKLAHLLIEGEIFCNNGWWHEKEGNHWPKDSITLHVICNDIFAWACADSEDITYSQIGDLYEMWQKDPMWGTAAWCIKKRKQMPQKPVLDRMTKAGWNVEELIK